MGQDFITSASLSDSSDCRGDYVIGKEKKKKELEKRALEKIKSLRYDLATKGVKAEEFLVNGEDKKAKRKLREEYIIKHDISDLEKLVVSLKSSSGIEENLATRNLEEVMNKYRDYIDSRGSDVGIMGNKEESEEEVERKRKIVVRYVQERVKIIGIRIKDPNYGRASIDEEQVIVEVEKAWNSVNDSKGRKSIKSPSEVEMSKIWDDLLD